MDAQKILIVLIAIAAAGALWFVGGNRVLAPTGFPTATTTPAGGEAGFAPYHSGIVGKVTLGPTCPVEKTPPDPGCAPKAYQTTVVVSRAGSDSVYATMQSDAEGTFKFSLSPGEYTVTAVGGKVLPRCSTQMVTVAPTEYVTADVSCDTGIR